MRDMSVTPETSQFEASRCQSAGHRPNIPDMSRVREVSRPVRYISEQRSSPKNR